MARKIYGAIAKHMSDTERIAERLSECLLAGNTTKSKDEATQEVMPFAESLQKFASDKDLREAKRDELVYLIGIATRSQPGEPVANLVLNAYGHKTQKAD